MKSDYIHQPNNQEALQFFETTILDQVSENWEQQLFQKMNSSKPASNKWKHVGLPTLILVLLFNMSLLFWGTKSKQQNAAFNDKAHAYREITNQLLINPS
jgi:hypothetical protein